MPNTAEATFRVEQHEDSAFIQSIVLGNFFGAKESIRFFEVNGEVIDVVSDKVAPDDGTVPFWSEGSGLIQSQTIATGNHNENDMRMRTEIRSTSWRPEHSTPGHPFNPERPWLELVEIFQPYSPDATWTFGYEMKE